MTDLSNYDEHCRGLADQAIAQLTGTCKSITDLGEEIEDAQDNMAFCNRLDDAIFCCTACGWWEEQPAREVNSEWVCEDCADEAA